MDYLRKLLAITLVLYSSCLTHASTLFPSAPIELIVPFTPGGQTDTIARIFSLKVSHQLGYPIQISNYPGRQAPAGIERITNTKPDGHTLIMVTVPHVANALLIPKSGYTGIDQLTGICFISATPQVVVVSAQSPIHSLQELAQMAQAINLEAGTAGTGSTAHLAAALFSDLTNTEVMPIPYSEGGGAVQALLRQEVHVVFANIQEILIPLQTGQLRALAVTDKTRHPLLPNIPTTAEAGMDELLSESWTAIMAPQDTPKDAIAFYATTVKQLFANPQTHQQAAKMGVTIRLIGHEDFDQHMQQELKKIHDLIRKHHITPGWVE